MSSSAEVDSPAAERAQPLAALPAVLEAEPSRAFVWDWPSFARAARAFVLTTLVVFVLAVTVGALVPGLPTRVLGIFDAINFWPTAYLSHIVPVFFFILLSNTKSALIAALLGPASVWVNARLNAGYVGAGDHGAQPVGLLDRFALGLARRLVRLGRLVYPQIGNARCEFAARASASLASVVPFMAIGVNAIVLGLWLAEALLQRWVAGLAEVGQLLLPHAPVELPALFLASAVGLQLARRLVPERPEHDSAWQVGEARRLITCDQVAQSLGLLVGLLAIAAALEVWGWV